MSDSLPLTFTAIDFEIANLRQRHSACSVGLAVVKDGEVASRHQWLIKPPEDVVFDEYCICIHGITPDMVCDKPTFDELWLQVQSCFEGPLVAHNASFDMSVLRYALDTYDRCYPEIDYFCSRNLAREQWPGLISYSLDTVAHYLGIEFTHHQAVEDAYASALVVLLAARQSTFTGLVELLAARGLKMGHLSRDGYEPARARRRPRSYPSYSYKPGGEKAFRAQVEKAVAASTAKTTGTNVCAVCGKGFRRARARSVRTCSPECANELKRRAGYRRGRTDRAVEESVRARQERAVERGCSEPGCDRPHYSKGLCSLHYQRRRAAEKRAARD